MGTFDALGTQDVDEREVAGQSLQAHLSLFVPFGEFNCIIEFRGRKPRLVKWAAFYFLICPEWYDPNDARYERVTKSPQSRK